MHSCQCDKYIFGLCPRFLTHSSHNGQNLWGERGLVYPHEPTLDSFWMGAGSQRYQGVIRRLELSALPPDLQERGTGGGVNYQWLMI